MRNIHTKVEENRGASIPDWAYRDVLFMLIHYSIASYELLEEKLTDDEKLEVYDVFFRMGTRMGLKELPLTYFHWLPVREAHLSENLQNSKFTKDLFNQYKKHLGLLRFTLLIGVQKLLVPKKVKILLNWNGIEWYRSVLIFYKISRLIKMDGLLKKILLPAKYKDQIKELNIKLD